MPLMSMSIAQQIPEAIYLDCFGDRHTRKGEACSHDTE
jgi:hypothetical protein